MICYKAGIDRIDNHVEEKHDRGELEPVLEDMRE
jgi:hypothetical protein